MPRAALRIASHSLFWMANTRKNKNSVSNRTQQMGCIFVGRLVSRMAIFDRWIGHKIIHSADHRSEWSHGWYSQHQKENAGNYRGASIKRLVGCWSTGRGNRILYIPTAQQLDARSRPRKAIWLSVVLVLGGKSDLIGSQMNAAEIGLSNVLFQRKGRGCKCNGIPRDIGHIK